MKDVVHIIGHKNPDTDSIVSAIAYAQLKQKLGINAIACRLGELNPETDFVLKKFQVPEPVYIQNARVKLYDVPFDEPLLLKKDDTIKEAWDRMGMRSTSALFVVDEAQKLIGVVSLSDMTNILMSDKGEKPISLMKNTSCENIRKVLQGEFLYECEAYRTNGRIHILCSRNAEYSDISYRDSIVVVNDDLKLQKRALSDGAGCMILVDVDIISQGIIRMAKEANCTIIKTPLNMFQVARSMYRSPSVNLIMKRKIISFNNHAYIDDVYKQMSKSRFRSYPVVNNQGVVLGSISRYHLLNYQKKKFILVDHNELSQSIDDLKEAEILEVVDHHRIGDVETTTPIRFRNEIIGSTASIITSIYLENQMSIPKDIAGLLLGAILSDTLKFKSPTTTAKDKGLAKMLAEVAELDIDVFAKEMFKVSSNISNKTPRELLNQDIKKFEIDGRTVMISQVIAYQVSEAKEIEETLQSEMEKFAQEKGLDLLVVAFTSILENGSVFYAAGEIADVVAEAFPNHFEEEHSFQEDILSRKNQIVPLLSRAIINSVH